MAFAKTLTALALSLTTAFSAAAEPRMVIPSAAPAFSAAHDAQIILAAALSADHPALGLVTDAVEDLMAGLRSNPSAVYGNLNAHVVPRIDFRSMAMTVIGPPWRTMTEDQQDRFTHEFARKVLRQYAQALQLAQGLDVEVTGGRSTSNVRLVEIDTVVTVNGRPRSVDYVVRQSSNSGRWYVVNVLVEGISLLNRYKGEFGRIMDEQPRGSEIEGLIAALKAENDRGRAPAVPSLAP